MAEEKHAEILMRWKGVEEAWTVFEHNAIPLREWFQQRGRKLDPEVFKKTKPSEAEPKAIPKKEVIKAQPIQPKEPKKELPRERESKSTATKPETESDVFNL